MQMFLLLAFVSLLLFPFTTSCWFDYPRKCSPSDIQIYQGPSGFNGLHIPQYTVQIVNEASAIDGIFDVQIHCGEFASANLIEPKIFRRIGCGICLLKNGSRILPGEVISFEYSNILPYDFSVIQVKC
uniref:Uncharacterized protein LOC104246915 n=1 Tax=Nicotiana sylvestris TaxID=4096 RepID=A0A1U7YQK7_NICSY|nr:PREDICTED: uncharacterized protein LOC104246915 [Nicotiana sylvestris]